MRVPNPSNNWISHSAKDFKNATVLVSYCCHTQNLVLKTTQMYSVLSYIGVRSLIGQKSDTCLTGLKSRHSRAALPSGGSKRNPFLCVFQLLETICNPWLMVPFLHLQSQAQPVESFSHPITLTLLPSSNLSLWLIIPSSTSKDHCITLGPPR